MTNGGDPPVITGINHRALISKSSWMKSSWLWFSLAVQRIAEAIVSRQAVYQPKMANLKLAVEDAVCPQEDCTGSQEE